MSGKITFSNPRGADYVFGDCRPLRFEGQKLSAMGQDEPLAEHVGHSWATAKGEFLRIDCECPVSVYFERGGYRSKVFGPYEHVSSLNGVVYGDRIVIAFCDAQNNDWYSTDLHLRGASCRRDNHA
jgi:hypothetical protein